MSIRIVILFGCMQACRLATASDVCEIDNHGIAFSKEARIIPYQRVYLDDAWSSDERDGEAAHRYPITGLVGSTGKFDVAGLYVSAYPADYFPVNLVQTNDPYVFRLDGIMWTNPPLEAGPSKHYIEKYSSKDLTYRLSLADNKRCSEDGNLSVDVYKSMKRVETILFHVRDMSDAKDFWPEERSKATNRHRP